MSNQRVSVIMPAYKCADVIGNAIDSLLAQTRQPDQIIVVDDGSPDDLPAALRRFGERVTYIRKTNGGASSARNAAFEHVTGDLIAFLDADDLWHPTKLKDQLDIFERHPEVGLVSSRYRIDSIDGNIEGFPELDATRWDCAQSLHGPKVFDAGMLAWTSVVVFRRSILGGDRFDTGLKIAEDRDLWVRLIAKAPVYFQSAVTATLMEYKGSLSRGNLDLDCRSMLRLIHRHAALLGPAGVRQWRTRVYRRWAGTYLSQGNKRAIRPAMHRLWYQPFSAEGWYILLKSSFCALRAARSTEPVGAERLAS